MPYVHCGMCLCTHTCMYICTCSHTYTREHTKISRQANFFSNLFYSKRKIVIEGMTCIACETWICQNGSDAVQLITVLFIIQELSERVLTCTFLFSNSSNPSELYLPRFQTSHIYSPYLSLLVALP